MQTLVDMLRQQAERNGSGLAFTLLEESLVEKPSLSLTYAELERRARAVAAELQAAGAAGDRALLLFPAGLEFLVGFFGCLYAGVIGVPAPPPEASRAKRTGPRLRAITEDCAASWVVTTSAINEMAGALNIGDRPLRVLATDRVDLERAQDWREPRLDPSAAAYLQYTSGSTTAARGVVITHRNLVTHSEELRAACGYDADSVTVTWMPNFHDYGLVEGLIVPLANGTPCYVMSPFSFVKRPSSWLKALSRYRGTHSQAPNFAYDYCARRVSAPERAGLDLSSWKMAGNGAEPINPRVLDSFYRTFQDCGFRWEAFSPAYGLAEATLQVSSTPAGEAPVIGQFRAEALEAGRVERAEEGDPATRAVVACGRPFGSVRVAIVHPETQRRCGPEEVGEVWVSGLAVADGYWERPSETKEIFQAVTADEGSGPYLRTGDLGFLDDGRLFIIGRLKDLIIIRGTNHAPQDIEWTAQEAHSSLRPENVAAFSVIVDGEERLVVVQEVERGLAPGKEADAAVEAIRRAISAGHELDTYSVALVRRGTLPKTASGKIQRRAARAAYLAGTLDTVVSWTAPRRPEPAIAASEGPRFVPAPPQSDTGSRQRADDLISWMRSYAGERINSRLMDERRCIPPYIILDFGNRGLLGLQVPRSYGGLGLDMHDALRVIEQLAAIDLTLATVVLLHNTNGLRPIQHFARPALRDELLPVVARGRELAAFALSEPGAGANVAGIRGEVKPDPAGGWRIRAIKRWNAASWAGVVSVFVRLVGPDGRLGGLTGFAVRQGAPGLRIGPEALTTGLRGSVQNSLYLNDVSVGPADLLGELEGGATVADDALAAGRLLIAAACLGTARRCSQLMLRYAGRRSVATGRLIDNPVTRVRLGWLTAAIEATEALIYGAARIVDTGRTLPMELAMAAKVIATEVADRAANDLVQLLGGRGYMENNLAPQILRDARAMSIGEGPNEVLLAYLGRSVCQSEAVAQLLAEGWNAADLAKQVSETAGEVVERCQAPGGPFAADRTAALAWAHSLIGRAATEALGLAAARAPGSQAREATVGWARARFEGSLAVARRGTPDEMRALTAEAAARTIDGYTEFIGDVEQGLPGEEDALEPSLRQIRGPLAGGLREELPGAERPVTDPIDRLTPEAKRALLQQLMARESNPACANRPTPNSART
jgi:acyl-CoA synthetase (AMP-forming)/AMP-acid ligase II/alkylation response protein AidB-like acyl-CoA dehydrogenase